MPVKKSGLPLKGGSKFNKKTVLALLLLLVPIAGFVLYKTFAAAPVKLVYADQPTPGGSVYITTVNPDGSGKKQLTTGYTPSWSPDALKILFSSPEGRLYTIKMDGTGLTAIPAPATPASVLRSDAKWSFDGKKIVYARRNISNNTGEVWVMNSDGTNDHKVGGTTGQVSKVFWSPKALKLVFEDGIYPDNKSYVVNWDGTGLTQIPNTSFLVDWNPWSQDGNFVLSLKTAPTPGTSYYIYTPATGASVKLAFPSYNPSPSGSAAFASSGTQQTIVFNGGDSKLYTTSFTDPANPSQPVNIVPAFVTNLAVSPDGTKISYTKEPTKLYTNVPTGGKELPLATRGWNGPANWQPILKVQNYNYATPISNYTAGTVTACKTSSRVYLKVVTKTGASGYAWWFDSKPATSTAASPNKTLYKNVAIAGTNFEAYVYQQGAGGYGPASKPVSSINPCY